MHNKTLAELSYSLHHKEFSSVELTQHYLQRIKKFDAQLNSFITVCEDSALAEAKAADQRLQAGNAAPLTGIPLAQKDIFCTQGIKTSCGSKMLDNFISPYDATVITHFKKAGAVTLGKTNMDEFAMGSTTENSFYGPSLNPWDTTRVPGGSSGGSAAAMAARLAAGTTGTDTGGSIRQPAALCGITGIKPTYGRVSRYGMIAFASSLDQGGPMTQTAEDAALMLNVMAGHDAKDSTSAIQPTADFTANLNDSLKGVTIGIPHEYFSDKLDAGITKIVEAAKKEYEKLGVRFVDISLPHTDLATAVYYIIAPAECSSNLARFDGVRYGYRCEHAKDLVDMYKRSRGEGFGDEVKRRILMGTYALSSGYYDAYYIKAQRVRRLIRDDFLTAFKSVDAIFTPTTPTTAFKLGAKHDPVNLYLADIFTVAVPLAGLPGISVPAGFIDGLPAGIQLIGKHFDEAKLLNIAHQYQQVTDWHTRIAEGF